nr:BCL2/adenovirus E1B 19 kDa protein-interacting protein 2 [Ciona intestinalis]|eukprot:XP_002127893.1 BCL2/adenovirus E1B 19 kDa protein-interacting protein 2 [Ciona intestinalis]
MMNDSANLDNSMKDLEDGIADTSIKDRSNSEVVNNNESTEIMFEGNWEEDDLVALSGQPGQSFQRLETVERESEYERARKKLTAQFGDAEDSDIDGMLTPEELATPDDLDSSVDSPQQNSGVDLEWDNDTPVVQKTPSEPTTPDVTTAPTNWRTVMIGEKNYKLDMGAVTPYRQILSHGGYYGEGLNAIVVFSACYLPDTQQTDYRYIMDNLFLYIVSTLEMLVAEDYMIIFFNGGCRRKNLPPLNWLKRCYQMIHRRLRKNLKCLVVVHPSWYIRFLIGFFRPFISSKFSKKLKLVSTLHRLADVVTLDNVVIPDMVQQYDLKISSPKKERPSNDTVVVNTDGSTECVKTSTSSEEG